MQGLLAERKIITYHGIIIREKISLVLYCVPVFTNLQNDEIASFPKLNEDYYIF